MSNALPSHPALMIDFLTVELPDPVGIPVNAGHVLRIAEDGRVEWQCPTRKNVRGSWDSNMTFRAIGAEYVEESPGLVGLGAARRESGLEISGNPAKFLQGHNLFGSDDVRHVLADVVEKAKAAIWPELPFNAEIDFSEGYISRIDLTGSWLLDRDADVLPVLRAMEDGVWCPYRGRGVMDSGGSTLYYGRAAKGKRAKDWALKLYSKGREIGAHPLPRPAYAVAGLLEEVNRTIRVELTLRTAELKRLKLQKVGQWTPAKVREIWEAYVSKLDMRKIVVNLDTVDLGEIGLKPRHSHALAAWRAGNDLRAGMAPSSFRRLRKELLDETGWDIATRFATLSNVVPFRRHVEVVGAPRPEWSEALTAALATTAA